MKAQFDENGQLKWEIVFDSEVNFPEEMTIYCGLDFFEELKSEVIANQRPDKPYYRKNERW